jgi:GNAT superfamily N-acetyltransferase
MSPATLRVRPGDVTDAPALRAIRLEALADAPDAFGETFDECSRWSDEDWTAKAREWNFYLADDGHRVVGMARGESHDADRDSRWLFAMYVTPKARGGECARHLVDTVSAWAASEGVDALHLYVSRAVPRARAFYSKVGFTATGASVEMYRDRSLVCDEMRRDLTDFAFHVHRVAASELYDLRRRVLRGGDPSADVTHPLDDRDSTLHYGGFLGERPVVSASFFDVAPPFAPHARAYQLRYMATDVDVRAKGLGRRLLNQVIEDLKRRDVPLLWANARTSALEFYVAGGWSVVPDSSFVSAESGVAHVVIQRAMD